MRIIRSKISARQTALLCHKLNAAYKGGIPIGRALELLSQEKGNQRVKRITRDAANAISMGYTLEQALRANSHSLPTAMVDLAAVGERTGRLATTLAHLTEYYDDIVKFQGELIQAVAYPVALFVIIGYFLYPLIAFVLQGASYLILVRAVTHFAVDLAILVGLWQLGVPQWLWRQFSLFAWPFSKLAKNIAISHFCQTLALTLGNGMPPHESLVRAATATNSTLIEKSLMKAEPRIVQGATLTEAFSHCHCLPSLVQEMIRTGENTGELEANLTKATQYLQRETMHLAKQLSIVFGATALLWIGALSSLKAIIPAIFQLIYTV